jgi:transposase
VEQLHELVEAKLGAKGKGRPSQVASWDKVIRAWQAKGLSSRLIYQKLMAEEGFGLSESAVYRYVEKTKPKTVEVTVRVETPPGEEAQVDFGKAGKLWDPRTQKMRTSWIFAMVLSWSRHMYVEFVFDQKVETWLECHRRAFEFFGAVPGRLKIDNLKAGIIKACYDDPQVQRAYAECAVHYGFRIDPCRPRKPQHKGKVERGAISYVKGSFVPLLPDGCTQAKANEMVQAWLMTTAGEREHGTTRVAPLERFDEEKSHLQPLPDTPFEAAVWKMTKLGRDCHVTFEKSYYSAPFRLVGQSLQMRVTATKVELYDSNCVLVATHSRASEPGTRCTLDDHLPPHKVAGLVRSRERLLVEAQVVGPHTAKAAQVLLDERPLERAQMVQRILRLATQFGSERLEAACARGLYFDDVRYSTLKRILVRGLEAQETPQFPTADGGTLVFARSQEEFASAFLSLAEGGGS